MSRLDSSIHPELTQDVVDKLFKRKIYSALTFINVPPELIVKITGIGFGKVWMIRRAILTKFSSNLLTGYSSYVQYLSECAIIPTGIKSLDQLLEGGLITGKIYELCGISSSGKTLTSMTVAVNVSSLQQEESVLYIDTKNDILGHRLLEIVENNGKNIENVGELMRKIKVCRILKWNNLLHFLRGFKWKSSNLRLLIIDSVTALFVHFLSDRKNGGLVFLNNLANHLRYIAVEYKIVVLVTNLLRVWRAGKGRPKSENVCTPCMGKYWNHIPNTRIILKKFPQNPIKRVFAIGKSSDFPIDKEIEFKITKGGVE